MLTEAVRRFVLDAEPPFSFEMTVHKPAGWQWLTPLEVYEGGAIWTGTRLGGKPVGLRLRASGTTGKPSVSVHAYCAAELGEGEEAELKRFLDVALGLNMDLEEFYRFCRDDPLLEMLRDDLYGMKPSFNPNVFERAMLAILLQMAPMKRSLQMMHSLIRNYGKRIRFAGKEVILWPTPEALFRASESRLKERCNIGYRAGLLKGLASDALEGRVPSHDRLVRMTPEEARRALMKLTGIGEYSADILTPHGGLPLDVWSVKFFAQLLSIEVDRPPREMIPRVKRMARERWGDWVWHVFVYVANDLKNLNRRLGLSIEGTVTERPA